MLTGEMTLPVWVLLVSHVGLTVLGLVVGALLMALAAMARDDPGGAWWFDRRHPGGRRFR